MWLLPRDVRGGNVLFLALSNTSSGFTELECVFFHGMYGEGTFFSWLCLIHRQFLLAYDVVCSRDVRGGNVFLLALSTTWSGFFDWLVMWLFPCDVQGGNILLLVLSNISSVFTDLWWCGCSQWMQATGRERFDPGFVLYFFRFYWVRMWLFPRDVRGGNVLFLVLSYTSSGFTELECGCFHGMYGEGTFCSWFCLILLQVLLS